MSKIIGLGATERGCGCAAKKTPLGGLGAFGTSPDGLGLSPDGLGASPDGLGDAPPLAVSPLGNWFLDGLLGAGLGYAMAPSRSNRLAYAGAGAVAVGFAGTAGIIAGVVVKILTDEK